MSGVRGIMYRTSFWRCCKLRCSPLLSYTNLEISRNELLENRDATHELNNFLRLTILTADALAADRATKFLPILVAQGLFIGAVAVACGKISSMLPAPADLYINVEAHSIAFSAPYLWILPAVFLSSVIGVSQTQKAIPRILTRFQADLNLRLQPFGSEKLSVPDYVLGDNLKRVVNGGIYSWSPGKLSKEKPMELWPLICRNFLPITIVVFGTVTAMIVSGCVPPGGWQDRHCAQAVLLGIWLLSFTLTSVFKRFVPSASEYNLKVQFWLTFVKDAISMLATLLVIVVTQIGIFNRCDSYTLWDRVGLALPEMPDVAAVLAYRIRTVYPAIIFVSIVVNIVIIPLFIAYRYRHALSVFLQRDD